MTTVRRSAWLIVCGCLAWAVPASADPVLDWIKITNDQVIAAGTSPLASARQVAMVAAAVFDAANGIEPRFQSIHVHLQRRIFTHLKPLGYFTWKY